MLPVAYSFIGNAAGFLGPAGSRLTRSHLLKDPGHLCQEDVNVFKVSQWRDQKLTHIQTHTAKSF